jgi:hypothetical protein
MTIMLLKTGELHIEVRCEGCHPVTQCLRRVQVVSTSQYVQVFACSLHDITSLNTTYCIQCTAPTSSTCVLHHVAYTALN